MSKKASPAAIGGFVLGAIAVLVAGIVVLGGGKLFRQKAIYVSYFPGSVAGLSVGSPVQFQGVQVGQVLGIKLDYYVAEGRFSIPVRYEIWRDALRTVDASGPQEWSVERARERLKSLIEDKGLRAVLTSGSLVTGQYLVSLVLKPESAYHYVSTDAGVNEIPTVESTRDRVSDVLQNLDLNSLVSKATEALDGIAAFVTSDSVRSAPAKLDRLIDDTRRLVDELNGKVSGVAGTLDATLSDYRVLARTATTRVDALANALRDSAEKVSTLAGRVNAEVDPLSRSALETMKSARDTLGKARQTLGTYEDLVSPQSATRTNLDALLEEAANAARSLRMLADYLEQNPDALIKGKY